VDRDFAVDLFVLAMLSALIFGIAQLTGRSGPADRYTTVYRNVTDIGYGTKVLYEGYPVGQVEAVTPRPSGSGMEFVVEFSVRHGWRIPADSVATLVSPRLLAPTPAQAVSLPGGVEVDRPVADGEIGNRAIVHVSTDAPSELRPFAYHFWAAPPANMLQDLLVRCLVDGRVTDRVVKREQRIEARYTLFSQVQHLELQTASPRRVLLALDVALRDDPHRQLVLSRSFRAEAVPADDTVGAAVDALSQAFVTVCRDLVAELAPR
jgi:ABC-type uncharacterized transport system auxiliary subunit